MMYIVQCLPDAIKHVESMTSIQCVRLHVMYVVRVVVQRRILRVRVLEDARATHRGGDTQCQANGKA